MATVILHGAPDPNTGIGRWTNDQLAKAIREGVRPDKSISGPPMPMAFYRHLSDADLAAIIVYLRAQPAVKNVVLKSKHNIPLPPSYGSAVKDVKAPDASDKVKYSEYLANIGHCMECHAPRDGQGMLQQANSSIGAKSSGVNLFASLPIKEFAASRTPQNAPMR